MLETLSAAAIFARMSSGSPAAAREARREAALRSAIAAFLPAAAEALSRETGEALALELDEPVSPAPSAWHLRLDGVSPAGRFAIFFPAELVERGARLFL